tara:strand:+ start:77 stop:244 length:168 start_codon:yes stop_codon:yes gene_type:complete
MARPKLKEEDKKVKLGITISKDLIESIEKITNNKSKFIDSIIREYIAKYKLTNND